MLSPAETGMPESRGSLWISCLLRAQALPDAGAEPGGEPDPYNPGHADARGSLDAAIAAEPDDWSHATVELTLDDAERMEEAALLACGANPWHGETWRGGVLRFRVARTFGYGASAELARGLLRRLDVAGISGRLRIVSSLDAVLPVSTQGPTF